LGHDPSQAAGPKFKPPKPPLLQKKKKKKNRWRNKTNNPKPPRTEEDYADDLHRPTGNGKSDGAGED